MINQLQEKYQLSILLLLAAVAILGVFPYAIMRYVAGNYIAAIIDIALILGMLMLVAYAFYSKRIRVVSIVTAIFINTGAAVVTLVNGIESFLWVYPVFASTFFLVKPIEAIVINIIAVVSIAFISNIFEIISLDSFIVTTLMLSLSIFVYALHGEKQFQLLEKLNTVDMLTGALNRRALSSDLAAFLSNAERYRVKHTLAIIDLDHFKRVNDTYGHAVGDQVLKDFVDIITTNIRKYDRIYRFGGEEFVLLISDMAPQQQQSFIDSLRQAIKKELKTPNGDEITVSFGVTSWAAGTTVENWLQRADEALYLAKGKGRDCAVFSNTGIIN
jgi:diguanylate cyclase (GGDEF)-like protein